MRDTSHALFLVADNQESNKGDVAGKYDQGVTMPYETELMECVRSWRSRGGEMSTIPIYVFCPTKQGISDETIRYIENLSCIYIHKHLPETDDFTCGYWNVPISGAYMEGIIMEDIIIHIDLDMILIREPTEEQLTPCQTSNAVVGINEHRPTAMYPDFMGKRYEHEANTGFILSWRKCGFYKDWWQKLRNMENKGIFNKEDPEYSIWEERVVDLMYFEDNYPILFTKNYQVNGDVSNFSDEEILDILFFHGHKNMEQRNEKLWRTYLKRYAEARRNNQIRR